MSTAILDPLAPAPVRQRAAHRRFDPSRVVGTMTVDEWMTLLEKSQWKYHYIDGEVVQVAGASPEHDLIAANFLRALGNALESAGSNCEVMGSDQRIFVRDRLYYFPDLVVVCGKMQVDHRDAIHNPVAIVEVLSPTTESDDRTDKFRDYKQIDSLRHYILIEQNRSAVTHYEKNADGIWTMPGDYRESTDRLTLTFGDATANVSLAQIYRNISFPEPVNASVVPEPPPQ